MDRDPLACSNGLLVTAVRPVRPDALASLSTSDAQHALALSLMLLQRDPEAAIGSVAVTGRPVGVASLTSAALAWRCLGEYQRATDVYLRICGVADRATSLWSLLTASAIASGTIASSVKCQIREEVAYKGRPAIRSLFRSYERVIQNRREAGFEFGGLQAHDDLLAELVDV